jgi:hypothetical protein
VNLILRPRPLSLSLRTKSLLFSTFNHPTFNERPAENAEGVSTFSASSIMEKPASSTNGEPMLAASSTSSMTITPLTSFAVFPDFPFELRRKIWDHAAEGHPPRIVEIIIKSDTYKAKCRTSSPAVLSTCIESREAALKVFDEVYYGGLFTGAMINWERDILYFNTDIECGKKLLTHAKHPDWFRECRRLALHRVTFYGACLAGHQSEMFKELKNIEELIAVLDLDHIGGHPPERTSSVKFALAEAGEERRKYERLGDHMAYVLFQNPHIPNGILVQEVEGKASEVSLEAPLRTEETKTDCLSAGSD